jgi:hypothetical protein
VDALIDASGTQTFVSPTWSRSGLTDVRYTGSLIPVEVCNQSSKDAFNIRERSYINHVAIDDAIASEPGNFEVLSPVLGSSDSSRSMHQSLSAFERRHVLILTSGSSFRVLHTPI